MMKLILGKQMNEQFSLSHICPKKYPIPGQCLTGFFQVNFKPNCIWISVNNSWENFNNGYGYNPKNDDRYKVILNEHIKILVIDTIEDWNNWVCSFGLPQLKARPNMIQTFINAQQTSYLNQELWSKTVKYFDGVHITFNMIYNIGMEVPLWGWDVETLILLKTNLCTFKLMGEKK